jgi:DNA-binding beta-propeller fold protein YncE
VLITLILPSVTAQTSKDTIFVKKALVGLAWNGAYFIASYGENTSSLLRVSLDGKTILPFAPSFSGKNETYVAVSRGDAGFPKGMLYVSSLKSIYELSASGGSYRVFSTPPGVSRIGYLAFDDVGSWGHALLAVDDNGLLWSIAANGTAKVIEDFGVGLKPEGIAVAPLTFGSFGGYMFVALERVAPKIVAISPNDTSKIVTIANFPKEEPERVLSIPSGSDLFVAKWAEGTLLHVPAANLSRYAGSLLVITEADIYPTGTITVLAAAGGNVTETRLYRETHPHFEAASFVPSGGSQSSTGTPSGSAPDYAPFGGIPASESAPILVAVFVAVAVVAFAIRRNRRT